jgi:hypothetical protein
MPVFVTCNRCLGLLPFSSSAPSRQVCCPQCGNAFEANLHNTVELDFDPSASDPEAAPPPSDAVCEREVIVPSVPAAYVVPPISREVRPVRKVHRPPPEPKPRQIAFILIAVLGGIGLLCLLLAVIILASQPGPVPNPVPAAPIAEQQNPPELPVAKKAPQKAPKKEATQAQRWTVLFRSDDPTAWDTDSEGARFAVSLARAPDLIRYLRLRRMDTEEALIVPLERNQLKATPQPVPTKGAWWNGTAVLAWGGRHLGIAQAPRYPFPNFENYIAIMNDGWDVFVGSGFGHKCFRNEAAGQCYSWRGKELPRTVFEIAITAEPLQEAEQRCLLTAP